MGRVSTRRVLGGAATAMVIAIGLVPASSAAPADTAEAPASVNPGAVAVAPGDECGEALAKPGGGTWSCTFVDEFDGSGAPDPDKWLVGETSWSGFSVAGTCLTKSAENVAVRDGALRLTARDAGSEFTCGSTVQDFDTRYTGGHIATRGRFAQTHGRFEVRAKFPAASAPGLHAAFWMYPEADTHGRWPLSGEIDVAEWWSSAPRSVLPSLHHANRQHWVDTGWWCSVPDASQFHTYAVEWNDAGLRFFQDDRLCFQRMWADGEAHPFDHPFNLDLTMGVGTTDGSNAVGPWTELPAEFVVDHVKAWQ